jgi:hypothetical protein
VVVFVAPRNNNYKRDAVLDLLKSSPTAGLRERQLQSNLVVFSSADASHTHSSSLRHPPTSRFSYACLRSSPPKPPIILCPITRRSAPTSSPFQTSLHYRLVSVFNQLRISAPSYSTGESRQRRRSEIAGPADSYHRTRKPLTFIWIHCQWV